MFCFLSLFFFFFFFNDTATTEIYTLSLHDALPISNMAAMSAACGAGRGGAPSASTRRSEEHTSELQSHVNLVCRLLLEKKKKEKKSVILGNRIMVVSGFSQLSSVVELVNTRHFSAV